MSQTDLESSKKGNIRTITDKWFKRFHRTASPEKPGIWGVIAVFVIVLVVAGFVSPEFFKVDNILNVLRQGSALGIMSIGQTLVLIAGGIDLSIVSTMQLAGVVSAAICSNQNVMVPFAILAVVMLGGLIGLLNGWLVTRWKVPAFVATLSVSIVTTGLRLVATYGSPPGSIPPLLRLLGQTRTGPIPNAVILFAIFAGIAIFVMNKTTFGRKIYAIGGNRTAAKLSGVKTNRIQMLTFVISGILAAFAGLVLVGYLGYADQWIGEGTQLDSIAAPIIGGASFVGGIGSIGGTVVGVLLLSVLLNIVLLLSLPAEWQYIVRGLVIILAVVIHSIGSKKS